MQRRFPVFVRLFVIPVNNKRLVVHLHRVVKAVRFKLRICAAAALYSCGRIPRAEVLRRHKVNDENISAFLNVRYPRLPENIQKVNPRHLHVAQTVLRRAVPKNSVSRTAVLELVPPVCAVCFFKSIALHYHGDYLRQKRSRTLVRLLSRQALYFRVTVHRVRMLVAYRVEHPAARRARLFVLSAQLLPVPPLPELLLRHNAAFKVLFPVLVLPQQRPCLRHLVFRNLLHINFSPLSSFFRPGARFPPLSPRSAAFLSLTATMHKASPPPPFQAD